MPVVFEQPAPMAPDVSEAGGMATQFAHDMPSLASMYNNISSTRAQMASSAGQAAAHLGAAAIGANAAEDQMVSHERMQLLAGVQQQQMQEQHFQQQQQMQQQAAQIQSQLMSQELSQKEQMRLGQMQSALADVWSDPTLSQDEKFAAALKIKSGIDIYNERMKNAEAAKYQQQTQMEMDQAARQHMIQQQNDQWWAKNAPDGVATITDANGIKHSYLRDGKGNPIEVGAPKAGEGKGQDLTVQDYLKVNHDIWKEIVADPKIAPEDRAKAVADRLGGLGLPGTVPDFINAQNAKRAAVSGQQGQQSQQQAGQQQAPQQGYPAPDGSPTPAKVPTPTDPKGVPDPNQFQPFIPGRPDTMNPVQYQQIASIGAKLASLQPRDDLSAQEKASAATEANTIHAVMAKYGSMEKARQEGPDDFNRALQAAKKLDEIKPETKAEERRQADVEFRRRLQSFPLPTSVSPGQF